MEEDFHPLGLITHSLKKEHLVAPDKNQLTSTCQKEQATSARSNQTRETENSKLWEDQSLLENANLFSKEFGPQP